MTLAAKWHGWDPDDWASYWDRVYDIEAAANVNEDAFVRRLRFYGLDDKAAFEEVRAAFSMAFGHDPDFMQAGLDSRTRTVKQQMAGRGDGVWH